MLGPGWGGVEEVRSGQISGESGRGLIELGRNPVWELIREREDSRIPFRCLNLSNKKNDVIVNGNGKAEGEQFWKGQGGPSLLLCSVLDILSCRCVQRC